MMGSHELISESNHNTQLPRKHLTERDILVADPLALPNSSDRLCYIVGPSEDKSDGFVTISERENVNSRGYSP